MLMLIYKPLINTVVKPLFLNSRPYVAVHYYELFQNFKKYVPLVFECLCSPVMIKSMISFFEQLPSGGEEYIY